VIPVYRDQEKWVLDRDRAALVEAATYENLVECDLGVGDMAALWFKHNTSTDPRAVSRLAYPDKMVVLTGSGDAGLAELAGVHWHELEMRRD
jgi:hypothetical protein